MGSYINFINSMLELREQKLKEEALQADAERKEMEAITKSLSNLGTSLGSAAKSYTQNATANQLMNQATPPRAEAVMPGTTEPNVALNKSAAAAPLEGQIPYEQIPVTMEPATGGVAELKMRMAMDAEARRRMNATIDANQDERRMGISQGHLDLARDRAAGITPDQIAADKQRAAAAVEAARVKRSEQIISDYKYSADQASDKYKGYQKDAAAFNKASELVLDGVEGAAAKGDQDAYVKALGLLDSHYKAAEASGLKVEKPKIASWEELQAAKAKKEAIDAAAQPSGYGLYGAIYDKFAAPTEEDIEKRRQTELYTMPGYTGDPSRVEPQNYLAVPAMERPVARDIGEVRKEAEAATGIVPPGQVAAPVSGAAATGGGGQTITTDEAIALGIPNPVPGQWYRSKKRGYVQVQ